MLTKRIMSLMFSLFMFSVPVTTEAAPEFIDKLFFQLTREVKKANQFYQQGKYEDASTLLSKSLKNAPGSDVLQYNLGTALYKKNDFEGAVHHLRQSLLGETADLKFKSHFNLGNALYQKGVAQEESNLDAAINDLEQSVDSYAEAIKIDSRDADALANQQWIKSELDRLKNKKQQQQQDKQKSQSSSQQKDQDKNSQQQKKQKQDSKSSQNQSQPSSDQSQENRSGEKKENRDDQSSPARDAQSSTNNDQQKSDKEQSGQPSESFESTKQEGNKAQNSSVDDSIQASKDISDKKEALMRLNDYIDNEEPKQMLNLNPQRGKERSVEKDW